MQTVSKKLENNYNTSAYEALPKLTPKFRLFQKTVNIYNIWIVNVLVQIFSKEGPNKQKFRF